MVDKFTEDTGFFPVTFVSRDDIPEAFGFPRYRKKAEKIAQKLTDDQMRELASFIGEMCCTTDIYWQSINEWMTDKFGKELEGD